MSYMDPGLVLNLAIVAARLSGYALPDLHEHPLPTVREVTSAQIHAIVCAPGVSPDDGCYDIIGNYDDGDSVIVDTQFTSSSKLITEDDIVVHELTHWLQNVHAWGGGGCQHVQAREEEAYRVETLYIAQIEHRQLVVVAPRSLCMDETVIYGTPHKK